MQHLTKDTCTGSAVCALNGSIRFLHSGDCEEDEDEDEFSCTLANGALIRMFAEVAKGKSDALCMFFNAYCSVDCYNRKTPDACLETRDCSWTDDGEYRLQCGR